MPNYKLKEDENIYIDCNPVDIVGDITNEENNEETNNLEKSSLDALSQDLNSVTISDNLGFQFTIAVTVFCIIYGIGNYIFKTIPNEMLEKRISNL